MPVTVNDIKSALVKLGLVPGDIVLVHSSLKSFGTVERGAHSVITAFKEVISESGTLVMPTLSSRNFERAYQDWSLDRPSDTGLITETFRTQPGSLRSDQATHSVSAWGAHATYITGSHTSYGPRYGVFGDFAFSHSSPWQRMYDLRGKVVFIGIDMMYNTFKHFVEYRIIEKKLYSFHNEARRERLREVIQDFFRHGTDSGMWPYYDSRAMQEELNRLGLVSKAECGGSLLICSPIRQMVDATDELLMRDREKWFSAEFIKWLDEAE